MATLSPSRDAVTTINTDGSRYFLHPTDVRGKFTSARRIVGAILLTVYVALPWVKVGGYPAVFLDIALRRFHFFGFTFATQDLWLIFFLISGLGFGLFFVTALLGRIWCGWACPQTVFLDLCRRLERLLEGPADRRRAFDQDSWTKPQKLLRRGAKLVCFFLLAMALAHVFLAYFVSLPQLYSWMRQNPGQHWSMFLFAAFLTVALFFNFAWFREQCCLIICPYGRLQSALTDDDTMVIGYDALRGEPRGKATDPKAGACVNCLRCVQVCPTGIDIRQGFQIECIGCAGCIDACNAVMDHLGRPRGLVRYDSLKGIKRQPRRILRPRLYLYSALLLAGAGAAAYSFSTLRPIDASVTRMLGRPYYITAETVRNQFNVRFINKSEQPQNLHFSLEGAPAGLALIGTGDTVVLRANEEIVLPIVLQENRSDYTGSVIVALSVASADPSYTLRLPVEFLGPDARLLRQERQNATENTSSP